MTRHNDKEKIKEFYDLVSSHFHELWGEHLHHGYWIRGDETKERAQIQLIEHLAQIAKIRSGHKILDVGCGTGGTDRGGSRRIVRTFAHLELYLLRHRLPGAVCRSDLFAEESRTASAVVGVRGGSFGLVGNAPIRGPLDLPGDRRR